MNKTNIQNLLKKLDFKSNIFEIYTKIYDKHSYTITADLKNNKINFGNKITVGDKTTSNFSNPENLVVLECVDRLLDKGYKPKHLHLERKWKLGRTGKSGKADINVYDNDGKTLLMIECKTAGYEYEKEIQKMEANGGQLFSYLQQDRDAKYLCLYASKLDNDNNIKYDNAIVKIEDRPEDFEQYENGDKTIKLYQRAKNNEQLYNAWKETFNLYFHYNGIFDDDVSAYSIDLKPLKRRDLKELENSQGIFNKFAEILRHNNISDKSNAFNKVLSLFLCKVVDEEKDDGNDERVLHFQVIEGENTEVLIDKLQALYQEGMDKYLHEDIVYFSDDAVSNILKHFPRQTSQEEILDIFKQVKYYTNQEFAFKEIHNKELFKQNSRILKEVIKLFQYYKFKYTHKEQILGNFFELLLSLGVKQSEGQFFTPVPITRFIVSSIPIKENVLENLENKKDDFLPKVLDYACGSGHFLTEAIDEIQQVIDGLDDTKYYSEVNEYIKHNKFKTFWAEYHIFGIEKDYRLARTSQIACLLNGDGEANIIFGDGLETPETHRKKVSNFPDKVDIIITNPPYSVKAFKNYLTVTKNDFTLFNDLTVNSKEIETLFIEQTKKLLNVNGVAAIILPSSILKNTGLYTKAREIILQYFEIPAIVELGSKTFIATSTNTIILFLKRRNDNFQKNRHYIAEDFIFSKDKKRKMDFIDSQLLLKKFAEYRELKIEDYKTLLDRKPNEAIKSWDLFKYYVEWFESLTEIKKLQTNTTFEKLSKEEQQKKLDDLFYAKIFDKEYEKFKFFMLTMQNHVVNYHPNLYKSQKTVIIKTGEKEIEKAFLGYEKSERNGYEGIDFDPEQTKLFNENDFTDPTKANSYIRKALLGEEITEIHESLKDHIKIVNLTDCLTFDNVGVEKQINTIKLPIKINSKYELEKLSIFCEGISGIIYDKKDQVLKTTNRKILTASNIDLGTNSLAFDKIIYLKQDLEIDKNAKLNKNDIFISTSSGSINHLGKFTLIKDDLDFYSGGFCSILRSKNYREAKYISIILSNFIEYRNFIEKFKGANINNLKINELLEFQIPTPPRNIQKQIIEEIEAIEKREEKTNKNIEEAKIIIEKKINMIDGKMMKLGDIVLTNPSKQEISDVDVNTIVSFVEMASVSINGFIANKVDRPLEELKKGSYTYFKEDDILIAKITPCMENGKCGIAINLTNKLGMGSSEFHVIRVSEKVNNKFLFSFLNQETIRIAAKKQMTGASGHKRVPIEFYENLQIPVPPIAEQKKIVSEIENLEKAIEQLENTIKNVEEEKKEVLTKYLE